MKLIMHIGSPKTGSSSIQQALAHHSDALEESGVKYFGKSRGLSTLYQNLSVLPSGSLRRKFDTVEAALRWSEDQWQVFETLARENKSDYMLISSEHFMSIRPLSGFLERLNSLFSEVHAVAYIRDPVSKYASSVNQRVRGGARLSSLFSSWNMANPMPFVGSLTRYRKQIGADNLTVRNFDRTNLYRNDVVEDFFQVLSGLTGKTLAPTAGSVPSGNESVSGAAVAWLLILNESLSKKDEGLVGKEKSIQRQELINKIRRCEQAHQLPKLKLADDVIVNSIRHQTRQECLMVNQHYLSGQVEFGVGDAMDSPPSAEELRERTRNWVMSYLDADAVSVLSSALLELE